MLLVGVGLLLAAGWLGYRINDEIQRASSEDPLAWEHAIAKFDRVTQGGRLPADADNYLFDGLHLGADGYAIWTDVIRPRLLADFPHYR